MSFFESTIKFTVYGEFEQGTQVEVGSETFYFPLLYYNGHGIKDHFYIFKEGVAVGKILIQSLFEPYEVENQHILIASDQNHLYSHQKLEAHDSLLMDNDDQDKALKAYKKSMEPSLPKIKHKKKGKRPKESSPKPDWNGRFFVDSLGNFSAKHKNYKVQV